MDGVGKFAPVRARDAVSFIPTEDRKGPKSGKKAPPTLQSPCSWPWLGFSHQSHAPDVSRISQPGAGHPFQAWVRISPLTVTGRNLTNRSVIGESDPDRTPATMGPALSASAGHPGSNLFLEQTVMPGAGTTAV